MGHVKRFQPHPWIGFICYRALQTNPLFGYGITKDMANGGKVWELIQETVDGFCIRRKRHWHESSWWLCNHNTSWWRSLNTKKYIFPSRYTILHLHHLHGLILLYLSPVVRFKLNLDLFWKIVDCVVRIEFR